MTNNKTIEYYNNNSEEFLKGTVNADMKYWQDRFLSYLKPGDKILDAGCGSGRDSKYFLDKNMEVVSFDASIKMCEYASKNIGSEVKCMKFEDIDYVNEFNGIWACASLIHVRKKDMKSIIVKLRDALKDKGILYASFKLGNKEEERNGRFFNDYTLEELKELVECMDEFEILELVETGDVRENHRNEYWVNIVFKLVEN
jgi:cyclopropane fatty-acyl-phospholipid synthase-like methyltransferase